MNSTISNISSTLCSNNDDDVFSLDPALRRKLRIYVFKDKPNHKLSDRTQRLREEDARRVRVESKASASKTTSNKQNTKMGEVVDAMQYTFLLQASLDAGDIKSIRDVLFKQQQDGESVYESGRVLQRVASFPPISSAVFVEASVLANAISDISSDENDVRILLRECTRLVNGLNVDEYIDYRRPLVDSIILMAGIFSNALVTSVQDRFKCIAVGVTAFLKAVRRKIGSWDDHGGILFRVFPIFDDFIIPTYLSTPDKIQVNSMKVLWRSICSLNTSLNECEKMEESLYDLSDDWPFYPHYKLDLKTI